MTIYTDDIVHLSKLPQPIIISIDIVANLSKAQHQPSSMTVISTLMNTDETGNLSRCLVKHNKHQ